MSSALRARWRSLDYRNEVLVLVGLLVATRVFGFFEKSVPPGIYGVGLVFGAGYALQAIGIVLVYRSNRVVNFAQFQIGATAATVFAVLVRYQALLRYARDICPPCLGRITASEQNVNYWISLVVCLGLSVLLSWIIYRLVVRRFAHAPRLVLTVATIFVSQALPAIGGLLTDMLTTSTQRQAGLAIGAATPLPFDFTFQISGGGVPVLFHAVDVITVVAALAAAMGLAIYLRASATGTAIRAAAENSSRAETLGVNVGQVTGRIWLLVGLLSGIGGLLLQIESGGVSGVDSVTLVEVLFVAVLARLTSLRMAALAALVVGILQAGVQWSFSSDVPLEASLVLLIGLTFLVQRYRSSRAEVEQASGWQATKEVRPIPGELRELPTVGKWLGVAATVGLILLLGYPWITSTAQTENGTLALIYAMVGLSLLVLTGWAGQISLGQFGFAAVGAYVAVLVPLPFPLSLFAGALAGMIAAVLVGLPALKLRGLHLAVITLAFAVAVSAVLLDPSYLGRYLPITVPTPSLAGWQIGNGAGFYYLTLGVLVLMVLGVLGLRRSRTGRTLIAARDNERTAQSLGVNLTRLRLNAFAAAGFIAAFAGGLLAFEQHAVNGQTFAPAESLTIFLYAVIGGLGSIAGPMLGAGYEWLLSVGGITPLITELGTGLGGLAVLLVFPGGLNRIFFDIRDAGLRRVASRHHLVVASLIADRAKDASDRVPIAARTVGRGRPVYLPARYSLDEQWIIRARRSIVKPGTVSPKDSPVGVAAPEAFTGLRDPEPAGVAHD